METPNNSPDAREDSLARFPACLISPGFVASWWLRADDMRSLRNPRSLELTVDGNFCYERRAGRSQLAVTYWQLVHELPRRFAELTGSCFDAAAWDAALAKDDELPLVCDEEKVPFSLPFTRGGELVAELHVVWTCGSGLCEYYFDNDTLCLRYEASEEQAAWELIRGIIRDYGIEYHPLASSSTGVLPWWLRW